MKRYCERLCPKFQIAMDVLAKPWNGLIIATLEEGPARFGELQQKVGTIGDRMLAARLKELGARGLVVRSAVVGPPQRVEYQLSASGRGFSKVAEAIQHWGETLRAAPRAPRHAQPTPPRKCPPRPGGPR
jgi:DNA-binding HxlR family transcriptional regulator